MTLLRTQARSRLRAGRTTHRAAPTARQRLLQCWLPMDEDRTSVIQTRLPCTWILDELRCSGRRYALCHCTRERTTHRNVCKYIYIYISIFCGIESVAEWERQNACNTTSSCIHRTQYFELIVTVDYQYLEAIVSVEQWWYAAIYVIFWVMLRSGRWIVLLHLFK